MYKNLKCIPGINHSKILVFTTAKLCWLFYRKNWCANERHRSGWPTSPGLRAVFFDVFPQSHVIHMATQAHMNIIYRILFNLLHSLYMSQNSEFNQVHEQKQNLQLPFSVYNTYYLMELLAFLVLTILLKSGFYCIMLLPLKSNFFHMGVNQLTAIL